MIARRHLVSFRNGPQVMVEGLPLRRELGYRRGAQVTVTNPADTAAEVWSYVVEGDEHATLVSKEPPPPKWIRPGVTIEISVRLPDGEGGAQDPRQRSSAKRPPKRSAHVFTPGKAFEPLPDTIIHADWGARANKRWSVRATRSAGNYSLSASRLVGDVHALLVSAAAEARAGKTVLLGFDFAIGVPAAYADQRGAKNFLKMIETEAPAFFATTAFSTSSIERPFCQPDPSWNDIPGGPGEKERNILEKIGLDPSTSLRRCERRTATRGDAACVFLPKPAKQVAGATRAGWLEVLRPVLTDSELRKVFRVWPFDGADLSSLVRPGLVTIVETYPAELYAHLGMSGFSKTNRGWRLDQADLLLASDAAPHLDDELRAEIETGFGGGEDGEDRFDAMVGALGLVRIAMGLDRCDVPEDAVVRDVEGWIVGRPLDPV